MSEDGNKKSDGGAKDEEGAPEPLGEGDPVWKPGEDIVLRLVDQLCLCEFARGHVLQVDHKVFG